MRRILLTGATGYVGGRLLRVLESRGLAVRCLARNPAYLSARVAPETEVVAGDVLDESSLDRALQGIDTAYYLVHALGDASGFEAREAAGARAFGAAAFRAGVRRIIYLGGLGDEREDLSPHLRSRHEVGRILRGCGVPTLELRASIVIGSGSLSFEMIRALSEHLPVMITPRWVSVLAQPIGIQDLLAYMVEALDVSVEHSLVVEIGGQDRLSYGALMREYARQRGLRRGDLLGRRSRLDRVIGVVLRLSDRQGGHLEVALDHRGLAHAVGRNEEAVVLELHAHRGGARLAGADGHPAHERNSHQHAQVALLAAAALTALGRGLGCVVAAHQHARREPRKSRRQDQVVRLDGQVAQHERDRRPGNEPADARPGAEPG